MLDLFEETGDQEARQRWLSARTEIKAAEVATEELKHRLEEARGAVSPEKHIERVAAVQHLLDGPSSDERREARSRAAYSLRELIDHIDFSGDLFVALRGVPTVVMINKMGHVLGDITIPNMAADQAYLEGKRILSGV